ncbi:MAG: adenylate cyclase [Actinobacteria bacterium]|nr:adenylate cyclase [Actinomycetota bacterium]
MAHTVTSLFAEEKRAREIRKMFSSYVSPKIVEQLVNHPEWAKLGGERKEVTLLFSDIRGFTTFSEKREPEEVVSMLNEYFKEMTEVVFHWDGTLDKFIGDAILAFWGAPLDQPDHAERAVRCALHMSDRLEMLQARWLAEGKEALDCGIGINTGPVVIGNIGAVGKKMDYTVIGDHVNIGSRVQGLTKTYNTRIILTEYTVAKIKTLVDEGRMGHLDLVSADTVTVKGKETPVKVFRLRSDRHEEEESRKL